MYHTGDRVRDAIASFCMFSLLPGDSGFVTIEALLCKADTRVDYYGSTYLGR